MKPSLLGQEELFVFDVVGIRYAAVNRANRSALWLFVKALTFGTFIGHDIIDTFGERRLRGFGIGNSAILQFDLCE